MFTIFGDKEKHNTDMSYIKFMMKELWILIFIIINELHIDPKSLVLMLEQKRAEGKKFAGDMLEAIVDIHNKEVEKPK